MISYLKLKGNAVFGIPSGFLLLIDFISHLFQCCIKLIICIRIILILLKFKLYVRRNSYFMNISSILSIELSHCQLHTGSVSKIKNLLNDSFSVSCCSDDRSKSVVLDRSGKNLGSTCTVAVNNNRHRLRKLVFIIR